MWQCPQGLWSLEYLPDVSSTLDWPKDEPEEEEEVAEQKVQTLV